MHQKKNWWLTKIGEAKAKSIIEYRTTTKFNKIEDIKMYLE